jgi:4-coumarate--CoA ligase
MCSSGTTGSPKGVCKSHRQVITQIYSIWDLSSTKQLVIFNFSTLYWISGVFFLIIGSLYGQKRVITQEVFSPKKFVDIVNRHKVSVFMSAPSAMAQFHQSADAKSLDFLEYLFMGGAIVSKALCEAIQPFLPNGVVKTGYGTTEVDLSAESYYFSRIGSVGSVAPNVQLKIIDEKGENLGPNEQGEICTKTPVMFSGYFKDPEKTAEATKDGWVYSGDIGYFDDDGFLFIVDRKKDMLKFNNFQVYPAELEKIINTVEGVIDSCVVGVFEENQGNDLIFAFVEKSSAATDLTEKAIEDLVNAKVIDAKRLRGGVHFVESLPMTHSGKLQRNVVKNFAKIIYHANAKQR